MTDPGSRGTVGNVSDTEREQEDEDEELVDGPTSLAIPGNPDLRGPGVQALVALATGNPVALVTSFLMAALAFASARRSDPIRAEFSEFMLASLTHRQEVDQRLDELADEQSRIRELAETLGAKKDLTPTETLAVLRETERVYMRTFDPQKRELIAAALRSMLLDREQYEAGLRIRFLRALDRLTFGDVVALATLTYQDTQLGGHVGVSPTGRDDDSARAIMSLGEWGFRHMVELERVGLAYRTAGYMHGKIGWFTTAWAPRFLAFLEAEPQRLLDIAGEQPAV